MGAGSVNWSKVLLAGIIAGIVGNLSDYVMHGIIMADTYRAYPTVFNQEEGSPAWFFLISVCVWITIAILFGKTRRVWGAGWKGGATFGFFVGLVSFFPNFYSAMVIADFPYFLSWCWGGINMITCVIGGAVLGMIYKAAADAS